VVEDARLKTLARRPRVALRGGVERQIVEFLEAAHPNHVDCLVSYLTEAGPLATDVAGARSRKSTRSRRCGIERWISSL
jgi:hypothetical protein